MSKLSCFVSLAHSPLESLPKTCFEASKEVFGSLSSYYKELKLTTKLFAGHNTLWPSDADAKYQLAKFGHAQKAKFRDSFWV